MAHDTPSISRKSLPETRAVHRPEPISAGPSSASLPVDHSEENDSHQNMPPPYSGPTNPSLNPSPAPRTVLIPPPGVPKINYALYSIPTFVFSSDKTTCTTQHARYSTSPEALTQLIQQLATIPPKPVVRITGRSPTGTDFDFKLNLMNLFVPEGDAQGGFNYVKIIGSGELGFRGEYKETATPHVHGGLEEWAKRFCRDRSAVKHFALRRTITNLDANYLEGRLLALISSLKYSGNVTVSFPITHSRVVVHTPDKINSFFTDVTSFFTGTKKYEIVSSVWPFADGPRGETGRRCVVMDEETWFQTWSSVIKWAAVSGKKGWLTAEDWMENVMEPRGDVPVVG